MPAPVRQYWIRLLQHPKVKFIFSPVDLTAIGLQSVHVKTHTAVLPPSHSSKKSKGGKGADKHDSSGGDNDEGNDGNESGSGSDEEENKLGKDKKNDDDENDEEVQ